MAKRKNFLNPVLNKTLDDFGDLMIVASATRSAMKAANASVQRSIESFDKLMAKHNQNAELFMGVALAVPDYFKSKEWLMSRAHRPRRIVRENIITLNDEIADRLRCQLVCAGFEMLEDFIREVAAHCFFQHRKEHNRDRLKLPFNKGAFHAKYSAMKESEGTLDYFRKYVGYAYGSQVGFLRELTKNLALSTETPVFEERLSSLIETYQLIEYCRHVTVHEFGKHDLNKLKSKNKWFEIDDISRVSSLSNERTILINDQVAGQLLRAMAGIAYLVYIGVSDAYSLEDDFFQKK